jgi:hypothetical protein
MPFMQSFGSTQQVTSVHVCWSLVEITTCNSHHSPGPLIADQKDIHQTLAMHIHLLSLWIKHAPRHSARKIPQRGAPKIPTFHTASTPLFGISRARLIPSTRKKQKQRKKKHIQARASAYSWRYHVETRMTRTFQSISNGTPKRIDTYYPDCSVMQSAAYTAPNPLHLPT